MIYEVSGIAQGLDYWFSSSDSVTHPASMTSGLAVVVGGAFFTRRTETADVVASGEDPTNFILFRTDSMPRECCTA
jgi:hypothetical protein